MHPTSGQVDLAAFLLIWASLLFAPPVVFVAFIFIRRWWPRAQTPVAIGSAIILFSVLWFAILKLSFTAVLVNFVSLAVVYSAYCFLAVSCWRIPMMVIRILALVVAAVPVCIGYGLATIGVLGLGWIIMDYSRPPYHTEQMKAGLVCHIRGWGTAITDSGHSVHLYKVWPELPFLKREVAMISVSETNPDSEPKRASCADALAAYAS